MSVQINETLPWQRNLRHTLYIMTLYIMTRITQAQHANSGLNFGLGSQC